MNSKDIIKRLEQEGWYKVGGKGDHEKYKHPNKPGHVVVPHPRKDMPIGTLRNIYKQAGWEWRQICYIQYMFIKMKILHTV